MRKPFTFTLESESPIETTKPDQDAVFFRAQSGIIERLSGLEADAIEGLIALSRSDDWKSSFVKYLCCDYRDGRRAAPADVIHALQDSLDDFRSQVGEAVGIARDYPVFLDPDSDISKTFTVVGIPAERSPSRAGSPAKPKSAPGTSRRARK